MGVAPATIAPTPPQGLAPPLHPAKAQGTLPQFLGKGEGFAGFSTSRTVLHTARNGHISISRQRALMCRQGRVGGATRG